MGANIIKVDFALIRRIGVLMLNRFAVNALKVKELSKMIALILIYFLIGIILFTAVSIGIGGNFIWSLN